MNILWNIFKRILTDDKHKVYWRALATTLAGVVVFVTTYSLILPAITMDSSVAEDMPGFYMDEDSEFFEVVPDPDDEGWSSKYSEIAEDGDTAISDAEWDGDVNFDDEEEPDSRAIVSDVQDGFLSYTIRELTQEIENSVTEEKIKVHLTFDENAFIPDGTRLEAFDILDPENEFEYDPYVTVAEDAVREDDSSWSDFSIRLYAFNLLYGEETVIPEDKVNVDIEITPHITSESCKVLCFDDVDFEQITDEFSLPSIQEEITLPSIQEDISFEYDENGSIEHITFDTDSLCLIGVVELGPEDITNGDEGIIIDGADNAHEDAEITDGFILDGETSTAEPAALAEEIETEEKTENSTEVVIENRVEIETEAETEAEMETEAETEAETETEIETEAETEEETETEEEYLPAQEFSGSTESVNVQVIADQGAFPEGTTMTVKDVLDEATLAAIEETAIEDTSKDSESGRTKVSSMHAVDITFLDKDGNEIEPRQPIRVFMTPVEVPGDVSEENHENPVVVHVDNDGNTETIETLETIREVSSPETNEEVPSAESVAFEAGSFSVYALVYTVDFHWEVDGNMYEFSLPGGGYVSFEALMQVLGVAHPDVENDSVDENSEDATADAPEEGEQTADEPTTDEKSDDALLADAVSDDALTLNDIQISKETKELVADVEKVEFSNPEYVWVSKVDEETTVGGLKETNSLEIQYSADLTEEQITKINAQTAKAGDWALISMLPFTSDEYLTVTMKDGEVFTVKVTDAQLKKTVIDAKGDTWEITVTYDDDAEIPDGSQLKVEEILPGDEKYQEYLEKAMAKTAGEKGTGKDSAEDSSVDSAKDSAEEGQEKEIPTENTDIPTDNSDDSASSLSEEAKKEEAENNGPSEVNDENYARFFDIEIWCRDEKIEPKADVIVNIRLMDAPKDDALVPTVVHFVNSDPEILGLKDDTEKTKNIKDEAESLTFVTGSFSVYGVIYTVDFTWEVDGKVYQFSIPGGGYVTLQQLVEVLGIANGDAYSEIASDNEADRKEPSTEVDDGNSGEVSDVNNESASDVAKNNTQAEDNTQVGNNAQPEDNAQVGNNAQAENAQVERKLTLADLTISDRTKKLVAYVESVEFSNQDLVWIGKVDNNNTVGELKEANGLNVHYSEELTEEQIDEINAQTVESGDWALISMRPFFSEEILTVTLKNGDHFIVKVTDAAEPTIFIDKEVIIYSDLENRAMVSNGYTYGGRYRINSIPLSGAEANDAAHWKVEWKNNHYYLKSSDNRYLTINGNDVGLVNNWSVATPLNIEAGNNPDYRICDADNYNNVLTYNTNNDWGDGYFSAPGGENTSPTDRWLHIDVVETIPDRAGDWLLYFDDDFSEITIHVGETISLRPYNKWEWKEGNADVQTAHWNIGGRNNNYWNQIDINDDNGAHQESWDDGGTGGTAGFHWFAYVKKDGQLDTHYWAVQGQATQTGDYTLTNTKNGKTITVHVVDGDPVNKPNTINNVANIKVNLFDYDNGGELDVGMVNGEANHNLANDSNFKNESVNQMGGSNHFYFLSSGSGNNNNESWNSYTKDVANQNIVKTTLGTDGYPVLNHGTSNTSLKYLFDTSQVSQSWHGGSGGDGMIAYPDVVGMFQKDSNGYYYFNSNTNYFYYDVATGKSKLYEHTYTQNSSASKGSLANDKPIGFFPFHDYDSTNDLYVNQNANLNHHVGMSMDIEFMLAEDRFDEYGQPIIFDFSGDDDLWVFVEWVDEQGNKQSKLLLDIGGVHQPVHGQINFTNGSNTKFIQPNQPYTLKVFYLERGGCDSNCSIRFNLPIIQDLAVAKKLTGLTEAEKEKYKNEEFMYEILVKRSTDNTPVPYTYPNPNNRYEKVTIWNAAGEDVTPEDFTIVNGRFKLKDGETLTISYLDRSVKFTVAELNTPNMENFEVPNAERYYHKQHDASLYEEEINLTPSHAQTEPDTESWVTPQYSLEDTEKVTFTNTLKEKNLEVEKKWVGETHPHSITFKVIATVEDTNGVRQPYTVAALKESDGTTDKTFTLNDANKWRHEIEHLPVNTPDGKFIFYDIVEGHVAGYVLTGSEDITADSYNYCNVDVVKLWPDSNGTHTEVLKVILKNSEGKYYAGVDSNGEAIFTVNQTLASFYELKPENNYTHRFERVPAGEYTAVQLNEEEYSKGLSTYIRNIIQYQLENTPIESPVDPEPEDVTPEIHKRIDALRDGVTNPDSAHADEDLTDLYRLYLDYKIDSLQDPNGVDLLFIIDHSGSMNSSDWPGNEYRAQSVELALNGDDGLVSRFLAANDKNRWAAVGFKGPKSSDYTWSLSNPWEPKTEAAQANAGQNGSEILSSGSMFTRKTANIDIDDEEASVLSNYTAGFWRAEQFLLDQSVKEDGRKKVVIFITDGVPTLHIGELNGSLANAGTAAGSNYFREEYGGCPDKALTEFGYFVSDMTENGYTFGGDNGNIDFYAIGLGASMQTSGGSDLLNGMLGAAYGQSVPANHYMTITDASSSTDISAADKFDQDLRIVLGLNHSFSNLVVKDDLSEYVDLYGLADAGSSASAIMAAAKAKVTMTVPDPEHPQNPPQVITLYENGAPATAENAKFTNSNGDKVPIIQELQYNASTKTVSAVFAPAYQPAGDVTYTLSFDVETTDTAYTTYAASGYGNVGDKDTDFLGTNPPNATSVDKSGFRSNDSAKATYKDNGEEKDLVYKHPVIQVTARADIVKVDQNGAALEGAKFNLYDDHYDPSKTIEQNENSLIEANLQSKKPTDSHGADAVIRSGKLAVGTYYLVETEAPDGYNSLPGPVKITVTELSPGIPQMTAEIAGVSVGNKLQKIGNGLWKLSVQNTAGYELPHTGGPGTRFFTILGSIMTLLAGGVLLMRRRRMLA